MKKEAPLLRCLIFLRWEVISNLLQVSLLAGESGTYRTRWYVSIFASNNSRCLIRIKDSVLARFIIGYLTRSSQLCNMLCEIINVGPLDVIVVALHAEARASTRLSNRHARASVVVNDLFSKRES